jgi:isopenicillin N synthase-like dioxygenase
MLTNTLLAGAHTDFGAITLLLQHPGQEGLEVLHPNVDAWIPVPTVPNTYVVNVGDVLSAWTGGRYRSTVHRVINKSTSDRYSIPFFLDGTLTTTMRPLDGSVMRGDEKTVGQHLEERFAMAAVKV